MKGIHYNRHCGYDNRDQNRDDWRQPVEGETIILNREAFSRFFPEVEIQGEEGQSVKITFGRDGSFTASRTDEGQTHQVDEFRWGWSGGGANEYWFDDEAICLKSTREYRSGTGLTADSTRVVAYKRHVEVDSFRGDCKDETRTMPKPGKIWAEFVNHPAEYRANWTGFGIGTLDGGSRYTASGEWVSDATPIIGDALDNLIETMLSGNVGQETVCRHNRNVRAHIVTSDPNKISLYLCKSCRMRGVRWEEFMTRNRADTCPYFRRACKSVVEKSDLFPDWFVWGGDNLLSSNLRLKDGEYDAYEVVYVRRKDGFIRRSVLLLNDRTREVWMFRYNGFIPRTFAEFKTKYANGRQISGYLGTGPADRYSCSDPNDRFLSEAKIAAAVAKGLEQPLWQNGDDALISFNLGRDDLQNFAIQKGEINGFQIAQLDREGKECELEIKQNPAPFYTDAGASYYLIYCNWPNDTVLRRNNEELYRLVRGNKWLLLRIANAK